MNRKKITDKWSKLGLLDGLTGFINSAFSSLFEPTPKQFISDYSSSYATNLIINSGDISEVDFTLSSIVVNAEPRRIRAQWTPELAQDVATFHGINAEIELSDFFWEENERKRIKKQRYKDRKIYIKMIEEWTGEKINVPVSNPPKPKKKPKSIKLGVKSPSR